MHPTEIQKKIEFIQNFAKASNAADGSKVEFDHKGNWTEVDCLTHPLPSGLVPEAITKVVCTHYPEVKVTKIERDDNEFDVKLSNRVELTFNKNFQLIDID